MKIKLKLKKEVIAKLSDGQEKKDYFGARPEVGRPTQPTIQTIIDCMSHRC
ncbi:hypothetical protein [Pedobacter sp. NJ-S-72]